MTLQKRVKVIHWCSLIVKRLSGGDLLRRVVDHLSCHEPEQWKGEPVVAELEAALAG
jgi:hypothetical protein